MRGGTSTASETIATFDWIQFTPTAAELGVCEGSGGPSSAAELEALLDLVLPSTEVYFLYTESSWRAVELAVDGAYAALEDGDPDEIGAAYEALDAAWKGLAVRVAPGDVAVGELRVVLGIARQHAADQEAYGAFTGESFAGLEEALADAEAVLGNLRDASLARVTGATGALRDAIAELVPGISVSGLGRIVAHAQSLIDSGRYAPGSLVDLRYAVEDARGVLGDDLATAADVLRAGVALLNAMAAVVETVDSSGLEELIGFAETLDEAGYTAASWAKVAAAAQAAQGVVDTPGGPSAAAVTSAYGELLEALNGLVVRPVKTGLATAISLAQSVVSHLSLYAPSSVAGLGPVFVAARAVNADPEASQEQVDEAESALLAQVVLARYKADISALGSAAAAAAAVDRSGYTTASGVALGVALTRAQEMLADPEASQEEVDAAVTGLVSALQALNPVTGVSIQQGKDGSDGAQGQPGQDGQTVVVEAPAPAAPVPPAAASVVRVKAAQSAVTLVKGQSVRLAAAAYTSAGGKATVTWKSSKPSVAKVAANGKITAKKAGKTVITIGAASGKTTKITVTVLAAKPVKAKVTKVTATVPKTLAAGQTKAVTGKYAPARAVKAKVTYSSSNPSVASIDKYGMLVAHQPGKTTIKVKAGTKSKSYPLTIK
jgi:hypothetical protein